MKNSIILILFILISIKSLSQEKINGSQILIENGVNQKFISQYTSPNGLFIVTITSDNDVRNYVYNLNKKLILIENLNGYAIYDYSSISDKFLIGLCKHIKYSDSRSREFYTYDYIKNKFTFQFKLNKDVYDCSYSVKSDSIRYLINEINIDGIGSHLSTKFIKIK